MPLMEISVVPVGTGTPSFSSHVAEAVLAVQHSGLPYQVTPTATVIEGSVDQLLHVAGAIHQTALAHGTQRVITHMTIDHRIDKPTDLTQPTATVDASVQ